MRTITIMVVGAISAWVTFDAACAETSCKICVDQQKACMKNYAGPTCKVEYQMCVKSCKSKEH